MARNILFLAANPTDTARLRLDKEAREIEEALKRSNKRNQFGLIHKTAVRAQDLRRGLLDTLPQIVHFSGHGEEHNGIALEDDSGKTQIVSTEALAGLFALCSDHVECVILNACYSEEQADVIAKHIPYVIGMDQSISDDAAIMFATGFYDALGAGKTIEEAYSFGCNSIAIHGIQGHLTPRLKRGILTAEHSRRLGSNHPSMPGVFLEISVINENSSDWKLGNETTLAYSIDRDAERIVIQRTMGYLSLFKSGGPIIPMNYITPSLCPFWWDFPIIDIKFLNNSPETIYLTEIVFAIEESRIDPTPVLTIKKDIQRRNAGNLLLVNEGASDISDLNISFHLVPGDLTSTLNHEAPYPHSIVWPNLTDNATIEVIEAFINEGLDADGLINLMNGEWETSECYLVRASDGSEVRMSRDEFSKLEKKYLGPFQDWAGTMVGEMNFKTLNINQETHHKIRFQTPIYLCNINRSGLHKPPSYTYATAFSTTEVGYERRVPISHELKPGETDRLTIKVAMEQSSLHRFRVTAHDISGKTIQSRLIEMTCFVPRSRYTRVSDLIKQLPKQANPVGRV